MPQRLTPEEGVKVKSKSRQSLSRCGYPVFLPLTCRRLLLMVDLNADEGETRGEAGVGGRVGVFAGFIVVLSGLLERWGPLLSARARAAGQMQPARTRGRALALSPPSDWPGERRGCPGTATHPRTPSAPGPLRLPPPPWPCLFLSLADHPVPPRPGRTGRAGSAALRFRLAAGRKPKRRSRGGARGDAYSSGRPRRRRREPARVGVATCAARAALASGGAGLCAAGWGRSARGRGRWEAPRVCGVAGSARLCAPAAEGPPGGRGERGEAPTSRARLSAREQRGSWNWCDSPASRHVARSTSQSHVCFRVKGVGKRPSPRSVVTKTKLPESALDIYVCVHPSEGHSLGVGGRNNTKQPLGPQK